MPQTNKYLISPTFPVPTEGKSREAGKSRTTPEGLPTWKPTSSSHLEEMGASLHEEAYITDHDAGQQRIRTPRIRTGTVPYSSLEISN
jgi:hypothetical protein